MPAHRGYSLVDRYSVSGVLSVTGLHRQSSIIYLDQPLPAGSYDLPPRTGRAALHSVKRKFLVYLVFQPIRFTPMPCRHGIA